MKDTVGTKLPIRIIALMVCLIITGGIAFTALGLRIAFDAAHGIVVWRPDYEQADIGGVLDKQKLTDEDYDLLYAQTGLTRVGIDRALKRGQAGKRRILEVQSDYFRQYNVVNDKFAPFICTDRIDGRVRHIFLEEGDIVVTSSTHFSAFRMGHAGIVTDAERGGVLQAMAYGEPTFIGNITDFTGRITFMILSPKVDKDLKRAVAEYAADNLIGTPYSIFAGIFTDKNSINRTHCAHLVWYAYKQFGIDLDFNGGAAVTPYDLAHSPELELVQVFGFDPGILWK